MATWQEALDNAATETEHDTWDHTGLTGVGAAAFSGARVHESTAQAIADNTFTALTFDQERFDTDAFHDNVTANTRLTIPTTGYYMVGGQASWSTAVSSAAQRFIGIRIDGGASSWVSRDALSSNVSVGSSPRHHSTGGLYHFTAAQYVELIVYQNSGGSVDVGGANNDHEFWIQKVG